MSLMDPLPLSGWDHRNRSSHERAESCPSSRSAAPPMPTKDSTPTGRECPEHWTRLKVLIPLQADAGNFNQSRILLKNVVFGAVGGWFDSLCVGRKRGPVVVLGQSASRAAGRGMDLRAPELATFDGTRESRVSARDGHRPLTFRSGQRAKEQDLSKGRSYIFLKPDQLNRDVAATTSGLPPQGCWDV